MAAPDLLDELIDERTEANAAFAALVDVALERRQLLATVKWHIETDVAASPGSAGNPHRM